MTSQDGTVAPEQSAERAPMPVAKRRRFSIPMIVAAVIMLLTMASYVVNGLFLLLDLGALSGMVIGDLAGAGELTTKGVLLVLSSAYLFFGAFALAVLIGFLFKRKWAWSAAMTWTALTLALGLLSYFAGEHHYLSMLAGVVLLLVLNQASLHREFRLDERR